MSAGRFSATFRDLGRRAILDSWQQNGSKPRLGLAISGGVDSMALATLCSSLSDLPEKKPEFTGFIVDHGFRANSSDEARKVAAELERLNIHPHILKLDRAAYGRDPDKINHLENTARALRYRAMGKACYESGIESLLVAHHADDQAETVLMRMTGNFLGNGLRGIKAEAGIPYCNDLYGVYESGSLEASDLEEPPSGAESASENSERGRHGRIFWEKGGVKLIRPLLPATKAQLSELCEQSGTQWFEDHTNADVSLTTRNTLRFLMKENLLPAALQRTRLYALANNTSRKISELERMAKLELKRCDILLDVRTGKVMCTIPKATFVDFDLPHELEYAARVTMLRMLVQLVSPQPTMTLDSLHVPADLVFPPTAMDPDFLFSDKPALCTAAGVLIRRISGTTGFLAYIVERARMTSRENILSRIVMPELAETNESFLPPGIPRWTTGWQLWDNRYWVRLGALEKGVLKGRKFLVRTFSPEDCANLRQNMAKEQRHTLNKALAEAKGPSRYVLPAIVEQHEDGSEMVMSLPTLHWHVTDWQRWPTKKSRNPLHTQVLWDVRYKHVNLDVKNKRHAVNDHTPAPWTHAARKVPFATKTRGEDNSFLARRAREMLIQRQQALSLSFGGFGLRPLRGLDQSVRPNKQRWARNKNQEGLKIRMKKHEFTPNPSEKDAVSREPIHSTSDDEGHDEKGQSDLV